MKKWMIWGGIALVVLWVLSQRTAKKDTSAPSTNEGIAPTPSAALAIKPPLNVERTYSSVPLRG